MPSEIMKQEIKQEIKQETNSKLESLTSRRKRKPLKLEIPLTFSKNSNKADKVSLPSTPMEVCPTPYLESCMPAGENESFSPYTDSYGGTFFKYKDLVLKPRGNSLVKGANGDVKPFIAITPRGTRCYSLVLKKGKEPVRREIQLLDSINKNENAAFPSSFIQKILCSLKPEEELRPGYLSRHEKGGDLKQHQAYIQKQYKLKNDKALSYLFNIMGQLVEVLNLLHNTQFWDEEKKYHLGIVHNDLKPANIFVKENGHVVVADFGCAYFADEKAPQFGTIVFSDPQLFDSEKFCKEPLKNAAKSDIWQLGLVFELLLQGRLPEKKLASGCVLPHDLPDTLKSQLDLQQWAKAYAASDQCKRAREAKNYLEKKERNITIPVDITIQAEILKNLALVMQLPDAERPTSKELNEHLAKLAPYFGARETCEEKSKFFASKLIENIAQSETAEMKTVEFENKVRGFCK